MMGYLDRRIGQLEGGNAEKENTINALRKAVAMKKERDRYRAALEVAGELLLRSVEAFRTGDHVGVQCDIGDFLIHIDNWQ